MEQSVPEGYDKPKFGQPPKPPRPNGPNLDPLSFLRHRKSLTVECAPCNLEWEFLMADLMKFFGPEYRVAYLRYDMIICPKRKNYKECMVRYKND
jgi:hypothetical protein